jgi:hypothetical protein
VHNVGRGAESRHRKKLSGSSQVSSWLHPAIRGRRRVWLLSSGKLTAPAKLCATSGCHWGLTLAANPLRYWHKIETGACFDRVQVPQPLFLLPAPTQLPDLLEQPSTGFAAPVRSPA